MSDIWAIILAAGESKRMGSAKMLLPFRGVTIIEKVIENVAASDVGKSLIVLGCYKDQILKVIGKYPVIHCFNAYYKHGMLSSVRCGVASLPDDFSAVLVFPGDMPVIEAPLINLVIKAYRDTARGIIIPAYMGRRGHPILIDRKYRDEIMSLDDTAGLRALAVNHTDDLLVIGTDNPLILKDIDTEEDYKNELNQTI